MKHQDRKRQKIFRILKALYVIFFILIILSSGWLADNIFCYITTEERITTETAEIPKETIDTYICYTTRYGEHYHARECGYLWNSSYQTTVYEAKTKGYKSCSKCEPHEPTVITLTETQYIDKSYTEEIKHSPQTAIVLVSFSFLLVGNIINIIISNRKKSGSL